MCGLIFLIGAVGFVNGVNLKINDPRHPNASIYFLFGGMLAASVFGIFIIPLLYITAEGLRGWASRRRKKK